MNKETTDQIKRAVFAESRRPLTSHVFAGCETCGRVEERNTGSGLLKMVREHFVETGHPTYIEETRILRLEEPSK